MFSLQNLNAMLWQSHFPEDVREKNTVVTLTACHIAFKQEFQHFHPLIFHTISTTPLFFSLHSSTDIDIRNQGEKNVNFN